MRIFRVVSNLRSWLWLLLSLFISPLQATKLFRPIISGRIHHAQEHYLVLEWRQNPLTRAVESLNIPLSETGSFWVRLPSTVQYPAEFSLIYGEEEVHLYLRPSDSLVINADARNFGTSLYFSGIGSTANTYLFRALRRFPSIPGDLPEEGLVKLSSRTFRQTADECRIRRLRYWKTFENGHPGLPADFRTYVRRAIEYEWASSLLSYAAPPSGQRHGSGGSNSLQNQTILRILRQHNVFPPEAALRESAYMGYLASYAVAYLSQSQDTSRWLAALTREQAKQLYIIAGQSLGQGRSRDVAVALALHRQLLTHDAGTFAPAWAAFRQENRDSLLVQTLRQAYLSRLPLAAGQLAPAFALRDTANHIVHLSDLRGQVVYLEFWASWCGPCLAELPTMYTLKQRFAGQKVAFMYVSIDNNPNLWKAALRRYRNLGGPNSIHLRDGGFKGPIVQAYQLSGVPAYWVIGRDGKIVMANAPPPSSGMPAINSIIRALEKDN